MTLEEHANLRAAFADRLYWLRTNAGLSQRQLALEAGMSSYTVMRLELGRHDPSWRTLRKLARRLGVTPMYLWRGDRHAGTGRPAC